MAQLTKQDIAEVVEEVLDRKLDEKLEQKLGLNPGETLNDRLGLKPDETLNDRLGLKPGETLDKKLDKRFADFEKRFDKKIDDKFGFFVEHMDDKFDGLAEAISLMNDNMKKLAKQSDLDEVKADIKTIQLAVKDTNKDLRQPRKRSPAGRRLIK